MSIPYRQVRARYTADTVTVYQAYSAEIAGPALAAGRFVPPFKPDRMTWIKPSFLWMMYRCGWGSKPGQERVLAVDITRAGLEWALSHACLSHYDRDLYADRATWEQRMRACPVRVQWDPERSLRLGPGPASPGLRSAGSAATGARREGEAEIAPGPARAERAPFGTAPLEHRSLQVGLGGEAATRYVDEWIVGLTDVTELAHRVRDLVRAGDEDAARAALPAERPYPLPAEVAATIGVVPNQDGR